MNNSKQLEETKEIEVTISETLSCTTTIEVPKDFDESDNLALEKAVIRQIVLPSDCLDYEGCSNWIIDEFCVL